MQSAKLDIEQLESDVLAFQLEIEELEEESKNSLIWTKEIK